MKINPDQYSIDGKLIDAPDVIAGYYFLKNYLKYLNARLKPCKYCGKKPEITYQDCHDIKYHPKCEFTLHHRCKNFDFSEDSVYGYYIPHNWNIFMDKGTRYFLDDDDDDDEMRFADVDYWYEDEEREEAYENSSDGDNCFESW